jgi:CDP-paratose 2-epimerase
LQTVVFRQSCIYGYRQFGVEDQGWVAWFIIAAQLGLPIVIYGNGKQVRDVLFIDDLIAAFDEAFQRIESVSGQVFNIGGGPDNTISLHDLLGVLKSDVNPGLQISFSDWRPGDQPVYVSDVRKARETFGWLPRTDWQTGVRKLIQWVKENEKLLRPMFESSVVPSAPKPIQSRVVSSQQVSA